MYLIFFTKEGLLMISEIETTTDPVLSREDAIAILNTPDEELDQLIAQAEKLRRKYKGNHVSIHILANARTGNCSQVCAYCAQSCRSKADIDKYKWVAVISVSVQTMQYSDSRRLALELHLDLVEHRDLQDLSDLVWQSR